MMGTELTRNLQFLVQVVKADQTLESARKMVGNEASGFEACLSWFCWPYLSFVFFFYYNKAGKSSEIKTKQNYFCMNSK